MTCKFDISKALAATGYLLALIGGKCNLIKLVKMLYYADRTALKTWHRSITGDRLCSMDNGLVVSTIYDLIKGAGSGKLQATWGRYIGPRHDNTVPLIRMPDTECLTESERQTLDAAYQKIAPMRTGSLIEWCHTFPEWRDPQGSSTRIDPKSILRLTTALTAADIAAVEEEANQAAYMASAFGA